MKDVSKRLVKFLILTLGTSFISFLIAPLIATALGMLTGWFVGLFGFIADPIIQFFGALGIYLEMWEIGGVIGFIGGFLARVNNYNIKS